ncbi:hypothetical protein N8G13_01985 [Mycoplasma zalophi]|uniref:hypothetical protein n=1 Tax=Mycoplasma zalophi TaxID=191287 RepID=UPI0021C6FA1D|nr:hypothetical protein [Mycoplasma zalophi]MCU4117224.1 hypothetical protein [Mycoplasma zalophi]
MKKSKLLSCVLITHLVFLPAFVVSCSSNESTKNSEKPQLLNSTQIEQIKTSFQFDLTTEGKVYLQDKGINELNKIIENLNKQYKSDENAKYNNSGNKIQNDDTFKKYFYLQVVDIKKISKSHDIEFHFIINNQTKLIVLEYTVVCYDFPAPEIKNEQKPLELD